MFKEGLEYIVHSHPIKNDRSFMTMGQLKRVVNASKNLSLISVQYTKECNLKHEREMLLHKNINDPMNEVIPLIKNKHDVGAFFSNSIYLVLLLSFILFNNVCLVATIVNVDVVENMNNVLNNVSAVLIIIAVSHIYGFQERRTNDTG